MSISKITNAATDTISKTKKFAPKNTITASDRKTLTALGTISAGLLGLAIYSAAFINHPTNTKVELDIAEANKPTNTEENIPAEDTKKIEHETKLAEKENKLNLAQQELKKDKEQFDTLEKMLSIKGLVNREYYEQQYNVLKDFIRMDNEKVAQCKQEYKDLLNESLTLVTQ